MPQFRVPRRIHRLTALTLGAACLAAAPLLLTAIPAGATGANYVALGDSYSSGLGAGSYGSSGSCYVSTQAYPPLWATAHGAASFRDATCSGATTSDVVATQVNSLSSSTSLVSITVGGNDVGFSSVMTTCVLGSTQDCVNAVNNAENLARTQLPGELDKAYNAISAHAPAARVVVLGYPEFYDLSKSSTCIGLSTTDRQALNGGADVLDSVISAAAARHGFAYVNVIPYFSGHQICDSSSWLHSVDWFFLTDSYHPTASGQAHAYLPAFSSAAG